MPVDPLQLSKFLRLVLRHKPDAIGLTLDPQGWATIDVLIAKSAAAGTRFNRADLLHVVLTSDKKRFSVAPDGEHIRAAQGHSVEVELGLPPQEPPAILYHGTATRFLDSIFAQGLKPQGRQQVHLSADQVTAHRVGQRHGKAAILTVDAHRMHTMGIKFYLAENGVWLTDQVPAEFLVYPDSMNIRKTACRWPKKGFWSGHDSPGLSEQSGTQRATRAGAGWPQRGADRAPRERGGVAQRRLELRGSGDGPAAGRRHGSQLA